MCPIVTGAGSTIPVDSIFQVTPVNSVSGRANGEEDKIYSSTIPVN